MKKCLSKCTRGLAIIGVNPKTQNATSRLDME